MDPTLVYIGKAENLNDRLNSSEHEGIEATKKDCNKNGTFITIAFSVLDKNDLERIEACLIYVNKPKHNIQGKDSFNFDKTIVKVSGKRMSGLNEVNTAVRK
ncbi:MAG: GIY-YIG nuclease family protein [Acholeplasmataceae bacterium]|nr:GIY-YIG nuclease family protein [Acholeplasmataceae bacterium]